MGELRLQVCLLDSRAEDATAVESRENEELEREDDGVHRRFQSLALNLSPSTWSALEGLLLNY
jgi:hypothetical protein